jgi:hypothetical protein
VATWWRFSPRLPTGFMKVDKKLIAYQSFIWRARKDSNLRPPDS